MKGLTIGIMNVFLWFAPWYSGAMEFMGETVAFTQNGTHVGGMAYLLMAASILFAVFSYLKNYQLQKVFGIVQIAAAGMFCLNGSLSYALPSIMILSGIGIWLANKETAALAAVKNHSQNQNAEVSSND